MKKNARLATVIMTGLLCLITIYHVDAQQSSKNIPLTEWLALGPAEAVMPAFHAERNLKGETFDFKNLLSQEPMNIKKLHAAKDGRVYWSQHQPLVWETFKPDTGALVAISPKTKGPEWMYLAGYIEANRWMKIKIEGESYHLFQVYLDGKSVGVKNASNKPAGDSGAVKRGTSSQEIKLETGTHQVAVKLLKDPDNKQPWDFGAKIIFTDSADAGFLKYSLNPAKTMDLSLVLDVPRVTRLSVSPDGKLAALTMTQSLPPSDQSESWIEIRKTDDGSLYRSFRGGQKMYAFAWHPKEARFTFTTYSGAETTLWLYDLATGDVRPLLENMKDFSDYTWSPDGSYILYALKEKYDAGKSVMKKIESLSDRWPWWRDREYLYQLTLPDGVTRRLTAGQNGTSLQAISPDGGKIIFTVSVENYQERPYSESVVYMMDLQSGRTDSLWRLKWLNALYWSPDGKRLLLIGGPSLFGDIGVNVPKKMIPNEYDEQAYLYDWELKKVTPITRDFNPAVKSAAFSRNKPSIYFLAEDQSYNRMYRYDINQKSFTKLEGGAESVTLFDLAADNDVLVCYGSGISNPFKVYATDEQGQALRMLYDPAVDDYNDVRFGKSERWTFKNKDKTEIDGYIHYPPDFDSTKKYPCIVYYYGGTSPVSRDFGGRYPKEFWAANGYVVYTLQPSGSTGYGQAFSALHVNNWGATVADEIIDGVKQFLKAHPFVDPGRVGCIGASYGGFMTMLLQTRTDMFAAAVSHAGISSIASYWGEGYWGYAYSAVATANSFPWNRKDIYVNQSPLFNADKIKKPLLLLHGASDTNVPIGESIQLFAALKLLNKDVSFIQVEDQDHLILTYSKRIQWSKTIMAWFDKYLKNQPAWWEDLYGAKQ